MIGEYLPITIHLPSTQKSFYWSFLDTLVFQELGKEKYTPILARCDMRGSAPGNTGIQSNCPDSVIDFIVLNYRAFDDNNHIIPQVLNIATNGGAYINDTTLYTLSNGYRIVYGQMTEIYTGTSKSKAFVHEIGHSLLSDTHYGGCNSVTGNNLHITKMGGMMPSINNEVYGGANAWERWYLGWINIKNDLTESSGTGEYYLDDYFTTGDAIRIKLPYSNQYLWLENHQQISVCEKRIDWKTEPCDTNELIEPIQKGLITYVENVTDNKSEVELFWNKPNLFKLFHREGCFDFDTIDMIQPGWHVLCNNVIPRYVIKESNPYSGYSKVSAIRMDFDRNGVINYSYGANSGAGDCMDIALLYSDNTNGYEKIHGNLGREATFLEGQKIGISTNPAITQIQSYNSISQLLEPIQLCGVSVEILHIDANGRMKLRIRFDDYDFNNDVRMCGDIIFPAATVNVNADITMDKSGTINRTANDTALGITDFVNPSIIKTQSGSHIKVNPEHTITVQNRSTFVIDENSTLEVMGGARIIVDSGATLIVRPNAELLIHSGGNIQVKDGAFICISDSSTINIDDTGLVNISDKANIGVNDYATFRGYNNNCSDIENIKHNGCGKIVVSTDTITRQSIEVWNTYKTLAENFTVKAGTTLQIENTTISIYADKHIVVEPTAKLIINNATLTNYKSNTCNEYWEGIYIEGNSGLSQTEANQGTIQLINATIENANLAITTIGNGYIWTKTGGIIQATNTTFRNNNKDIEFMSYTNKNSNGNTIDNISSFDRCTFTWDNNMITPENGYMGSHVTMWQVQGITFIGCTFKDERPSRPTATYITHGILTNESGYNIQKYSATVYDMSGNVIYINTPTSFSNLTYGIKTSSSYSKPCTITRSVFTDNYCGIFATNSYALSITNNTFNLPYCSNHSGDYMNAKALGISLQSSRSFNISNNEFIGKSSSHHTSGVQIDNISFDPLTLNIRDENINNNKFNKVWSAIQSLGKNFTTKTIGIGSNAITTYSGLVFKCNSFDNVQIPMYITNQTNTNIPNKQTGIKSTQGTSTYPANNEFTSVSNLIHNYGSLDIRYWNYSGIPIPTGTLGNVTISTTNNAGTDCGIKGVTNDNWIPPIINPPVTLNKQSAASTEEMKDEDNAEVLDKQLWESYLEQYGSSYNIPDEILLEMAEHETTVGLAAIEMLYFKGIKTDYHPQVIIDEDNAESIKDNTKSAKVPTNNLLEENVFVSPNPTNSDIIVVYKFNEESSYQFIVCDINGIELIKESLQGNNSEQVINLNKLSAGTYLYKVISKEKTIKIDKLVIIK